MIVRFWSGAYDAGVNFGSSQSLAWKGPEEAIGWLIFVESVDASNNTNYLARGEALKESQDAKPSAGVGGW